VELHRDPILTWAARAAALLWGALAAVELGYAGFLGFVDFGSWWAMQMWLIPLLSLAFFSVGALSVVGLARLARADRLTVVRLAVAAAGMFLGIMGAAIFFRDPMHDLALVFGSHGRFGCMTLDDDGSNAYWLHGGTLPFILFGPPAVVLIGRAVRRVRRRAGT
jgi:hypothetical protein